MLLVVFARVEEQPTAAKIANATTALTNCRCRSLDSLRSLGITATNGRARQQIRDLGDSGPSNSSLVCVTPTQDFVMALWKENSNTATAPTKDAPIMTPPPPPAEAALKKEPDYAPTDISPAP